MEFGQSNDRNTTTVAFSPRTESNGTVLPAGSFKAGSIFVPSLSDESSASARTEPATARPAMRRMQHRRIGSRPRPSGRRVRVLYRAVAQHVAGAATGVRRTGSPADGRPVAAESQPR